MNDEEDDQLIALLLSLHALSLQLGSVYTVSQKTAPNF